MVREVSVENGSWLKLEREELRQTLQLGAVFALITVVVHIVINLRAQHVGYGLFRDEMYYIVCGRNLAWGYVDQPPIVALAARFSELVFGWHSLWLFRLLPSLAGGLEVAGTGLLVREMGGGRMAQILAMIGVMAAPGILGIDSFLSMNCFEPLFWMGTAYSVLRAVRGDTPRWWAIAGISAGLGLENKWNEFFFLFAMLAALLLTPARRALGRSFALCFALIVLIALPNLLWEIPRGWPTLVWLHNAATQGKNIVYGPGDFLLNQVLMLGPLSCLLWLGGLVWLLTNRAAQGLRWIGVMYVLYLLGMMALHANDYYLAPVYPLLFAAGAVAWDEWLTAEWSRRVAAPVYTCIIVAFGLLGTLSVEPVLTPPEYARYITPIGLKPRDFNPMLRGLLPELPADMTGWRDVADKVAQTYWSLPLSDRSKAGILVGNYGEAAAITLYRPDLPVAISGNQNYWYWGPRVYDGSVMVVFGESRELLEQRFASVREVARTTNKWGHYFEAAPVYICRNAKQDLRESWPEWKEWF